MQQTVLLKQELLNSIKNQTDGFRLGEIWKISDQALGALVPILRHKDFKREYLMIEEISPKKYKIVDSGNINQIKIKGKFDKSIFIRTGNMFEGQGTQSRANEFSVIIIPTKKEEEIIIQARCIHASHPISGGAEFKRFGYAPREVNYSLFAGSGQHAVWASVFHSSARLASLAGEKRFKTSDSMVDNLKQIKQDKSKISNLIKKIPCLENQVGIIIFDEKGIANIEVFDHPDSWKAFHESIIQNYSDILSKEQDDTLFELKKEVIPKKITQFIEKLKNTEESQVFSEKGATTIIIKNDEIVGEYTLLNNKIIHLLASKRELLKESPTTPSSMWIYNPQSSGTYNGWNSRRERRQEPLLYKSTLN